MKIKEVIEKTGLTDRAIRLYIDEGLTAPSIEESYSGRKKIEFSESDVERLKNVAILRKAGFSVSDIKSIADDSENAKEIVENLIKQTEENIENETEIVKRLKSISFDGKVTMNAICESLSATVEEKEVPQEDIKLTPIEKVLKIVTILLSCTFLAHAIWFIINCSIEIFNVRYIKLTDDLSLIIGSLFYLGWIVIAVLLITVILKNIGKRFNRKTKGTSWVLLILSVVGSIVMLLITIFLLFCSITPFYSQTTDPENYLKLDKALTEHDEKWGTLDYMYRIFPRKISESAREYYPDTIKYFYEYTPDWDCGYGTYDICAEWVLTDAQYEIFKKNLLGDFILENRLIEIQHMEKNEYQLEYIDISAFFTESAIENSGYNVILKGDWTLIYYEGYGKVRFDYINGSNKVEKCDDELKYSESKNEFEIENWDGYVGKIGYRTDYNFLICAYNDKEQKVRYITSACCGHANRKGGPYYLSLDW
ncbi:MAG: MerR family transcriptional regulator [Clostridia bacterium]|nr:MerR family transcriptional regulator [Clostridia bacterium]